MNTISIILLSIVLLLFLAAFRSHQKGKNRKSCCRNGCGCDGCRGC